MNKVTSLFGFGGTATIDVIPNPTDRKKFFTSKTEGKTPVKLPIYSGEDDISGVVNVKLQDTKKFQHLGIKIEVVGHLEIFSDKNLSTDFMAMSKQLEPAGILTEDKSFAFKFSRFQKPHETFNGLAGRVRYFLRASMNRNYNAKIIKEVDFAVQLPNPERQKENQIPIRLEVGIEDCLHIEFEYDKTHYHVKDVLVGKVSFHLVKIRIKSMFIAIVRKETFGTTQQSKTENDTLLNFQVMDGCPIKGETIPIRMFFSGIDLNPSYENINNRLSVKHTINLVIVDEEDRKYFKQHEITIYRKK